MAYKEKFTETDWAMVLEAPMLAGLAITAADPGGLIGAVQESAAMAGSLKDASAGSLAAEVAEAYKTSEGRSAAMDGVKALVKGKKPPEITEAAITRLSEILGTVKTTAPEEAGAFSEFLIDTATRTAEAAKEGGFLGFGGEAVSDAEKKTLTDLRAALGGSAAV
ncbi:hypothetical protein CEW88_14465 [Alloyangia pacifica]|uniref:Uncharacterized protein n=1 Tax=Alloyangia pacifica TaxID=311180 RepID=A0A2U8HIY1_9RHOB|nr:hypothetical protein [Alloyangia pacifica]AWI84976.1 hypothetical protein CEW88_14465 [Alloyangia pacifica]